MIYYEGSPATILRRATVDDHAALDRAINTSRRDHASDYASAPGHASGLIEVVIEQTSGLAIVDVMSLTASRGPVEVHEAFLAAIR